jgi:hypothetical protein
VESISWLLSDPKVLAPETQTICDRILRLAEAVGAQNIWNPEVSGVKAESMDIELLLSNIEKKIGAKVEFPNPFPNELGVNTSRGVVGYRAIQALYQAWRLSVLSKQYGKKIIEIGGGLGRTAFFANRFGLNDYTIVDLPLGIVAQAAFLSCVLGDDAISLPGEKYKVGSIKMETPKSFTSDSTCFDIVINVDSMPEMDLKQANDYVNEISARSKIFLSINHEAGSFKVVDLNGISSITPYRQPYFLRRGYVEELFVIKK